MAYELKEKQANLFYNKFKKEDKHPKFKGELLINGEPFEIAMWEKQSQTNGYTFFSIKLSPKKAKEGKNNDLPF